MAVPQLVLGAFNLTDWLGVTYNTHVIAEGTSKGAPVPLEVAVQSWLQDGSVVVTQGYDNRTVTLRVKLRGPSLTAVAQAEAALFAELGKPNTLTWTPASGPAAVFNVVTSSMEAAPSQDEDLSEALAFPWRTYNLRLLCEAFTRSATETVATALPASGTTTTLVNDGSATTGWTGAVSSGVLSGPTVVSGAVKVGTNAVVAGNVTVSETLTASITTSSTKYIQVDWKPESTIGSPILSAFADGVALTKAGQAASPTSGFTRTWFGPVAASSIAVLRLDSVTSGGGGGGATFIRSLSIDNVNRTDIKPTLGSARQLIRSIPVTGSARASASLAVEHSTSSLGDVIVYTFPDSAACSPPLRQWRDTATSTTTVTTDTARVSGAREVISGGLFVTWHIPNTAILKGLNLLAARVTASATASASFHWNVSQGVGGVFPVAGASTFGDFVATVSSTSYTNLAMARMVLPALDGDWTDPTAFVQVVLSATSTSTITLDEAWLFSNQGSLVMASCGTAAPASGGSARRLFVTAPSVDTPRPRVRIGHAADGSDAYQPTTFTSWQLPQFTPPGANVLTVTSNALDASVSLDYFARWHTNPAS